MLAIFPAVALGMPIAKCTNRWTLTHSKELQQERRDTGRCVRSCQLEGDV